jgi:DNA-binding MarR family transcriptional regulator
MKQTTKELSSILPLIKKWETFTSRHEQQDLKTFAEWLLKERNGHSANKSKMSIGKPGDPSDSVKLNNGATAAILVTRLQRYISLYTKPHIRKLGFTKQHEYTFLHQISKMQNTNKKDLSEENLTELSTGRDIVKRLVSRGLVTEKINPYDKRASQLNITEKGKKLLLKSHELIGDSFDNFLGDLSKEEQLQFINLLKRLNEFHAGTTHVDLLSHL